MQTTEMFAGAVDFHYSNFLQPQLSDCAYSEGRNEEIIFCLFTSSMNGTCTV